MIIVDSTFHEQELSIGLGEIVRVVLPEGGAAGDRWSMFNAPPPQLQLLSDKTFNDGPHGARVHSRCLEFRVVASGSFRLQLVKVCDHDQRHAMDAADFDLRIDVA